MEKENTMERPLSEKSFENAKTAIEGGKDNKSLAYPELVENMVKGFKGKTVQAPIEAIFISSIFLDAQMLVAIIKTLESDIPRKVAEEIQYKIHKGEDISPDMIATIMTAAMNKDW